MPPLSTDSRGIENVSEATTLLGFIHLMVCFSGNSSGGIYHEVHKEKIRTLKFRVPK